MKLGIPKWWSRSGNALALRTVYSVCDTFGVHAENHRGEKEEKIKEKRKRAQVCQVFQTRKEIRLEEVDERKEEMKVFLKRRHQPAAPLHPLLL